MKSRVTNDYELNADGSFRIRAYNHKKPFSNFLPGIAGLYGTPMWVFYVNRGQGVASFGIRGKDTAILEFFPANKAYQMTSHTGFRTFVKYKSHGIPGEPFRYYEPFKIPLLTDQICEQRMTIRSSELEIHERNVSIGLETNIVYFTIPSEPLAVLAREVSIKNISSRPLTIEAIDGLPMVNPYGMNQYFIKEMSRTIEAWMMVENMSRQAPFMRLRVDPSDRPEVAVIKEGNFYFGYLSSGASKPTLARPVVDAEKIFGSALDFSVPERFFLNQAYDYPENQVCSNKTPCAFTFGSGLLQPGKSLTLHSFYGNSDSLETLNHYTVRAGRSGYFAQKRGENAQLIDSIKSRMLSVTSNPAFDLYGGQTYLDNVMRGGMPIELTHTEDPMMSYVYSRKHGDLERDYNRFLVEPSYFAQGDGNFRDVNQNRRNDVWFEAKIKDMNIRTFYDLIQLDGYNPLVIKGTEYLFLESKKSKKLVEAHAGIKGTSEILEFLKKPFKPGTLLRFLEAKGLLNKIKFPVFMSDLQPYLIAEERSEHGEGYWTDHWTYNLDLVESYLAIYPEDYEKLLFGRSRFTFFDTDHFVRPRRDKYFVRDQEFRQYRSVSVDKAKTQLLADRSRYRNVVRTKHGNGSVYKTTLFVKMLCVFANKFASLDPAGVGIEMEADKPSWYDALNGLPGLLGSSTPETFELKRLGMFMLSAIREIQSDLKETLLIPVEMADLLYTVTRCLDGVMETKHIRRMSLYDYWDQVETAKEKYRQRTFSGLSGKEKKISYLAVRGFLEKAVHKIELGLERALDPKTGLYVTYYENKVAEWKINSKHPTHDPQLKSAWPARFEQKALPMFLEGPVHAMKIEKDPQKRRLLYRAVRQSSLYDRALGMYKVNAPLEEACLDVGRARIFSPGWLENESIWLHMEYKWMLEVLKAGLLEEFFEDFEKALIPLQPPQRYGRNILENSSFLVSSVFEDASLHGKGFVARLSGSTAEFVHMWLLMMVGKKPFCIGHDGKLTLRFEPHLPAAFFVKEETEKNFCDRQGIPVKIKVPKNCVVFMFLGKTLVYYHNPKRLDTFGKLRVSVKKITLTDRRGKKIVFDGDGVPTPYAQKVRNDTVPRIDVELG